MSTTDYFNKIKEFSLKCEGQSMFPTLQTGDIITFQKTPYSSLSINDIILIKKKNHLSTHRVIYKNRKYIITKGDANYASDGRIYPSQITARVITVKRNKKIFNPEDLYLLQSTLYFKEIIEIKKEFGKKEVDFVFLKGLPLYLYYEKTYPRRIYADCDVLIEKKHFPKARETLFKLGYKELKDDLYKKREKSVEISFGKKINGFWVVFDIHFEPAFLMTQIANLDALYPKWLLEDYTKEIFNTKQIVKVQGNKFSILSNNHLIIYLALHLFHHNFKGAFRYQFLHNIIVSQKINFHSVINIINQYRLENFVYPIFLLLKKYYQTPIPSLFLKSIQPSNFHLQYLSSIFHSPFSIFNDDTRINAGIHRFKNLFFLSPNPIWRKILVFANIQVLYTGLWLCYRYFIHLFSRVVKKNTII